MTRGFYGTALIEEGRVAEGLSQCRRAVNLPDDSLARWQLANALLAAGDEREALKEFTVALSLDERSPDTLPVGGGPVATRAISGGGNALSACPRNRFRVHAGLPGPGRDLPRPKKDYPEAVAWTRRALQYDSTLFAARAGIARALWAEGRRTRRLPACKAAGLCQRKTRRMPN